MLEIQKYLKENSPESLEEKFKINVKSHPCYSNLLLFKYGLKSPFSEEIVRESRGLILDRDDNWKVICMTYKKFFNYGDFHEDKVDWPTAICQEKVDGSLIQMYHYDGKWNIATSGTPDASGRLPVGETTYSDLFWNTWKDKGYQLPSEEDKQLCFAFELVSPYNRNIVRYEEPDIYLHGVRHRDFLIEFSVKNAGLHYQWKTVKEYELIKDIEEILRIVKEIDPTEGEGFVVVDENYNRVKIKSPQYITLARMKQGISVKRMIDLMRANKHLEFIEKFPEYGAMHRKILAEYEEIVRSLNKKWLEVKEIDDRKEFALEAGKHRLSGILFNMKDKKIRSIREGVDNINSGKLAKLLTIRST